MSIDDVHIAYTDQYRRLRPRYIPALSLGGHARICRRLRGFLRRRQWSLPHPASSLHRDGHGLLAVATAAVAAVPGVLLGGEHLGQASSPSSEDFYFSQRQKVMKLSERG